MKHINVEVEDSVYAAAKLAAAESGMMFRKWVERAIVEKASRVTLPAMRGEEFDEGFDGGSQDEIPAVAESVVATSRPIRNVSMVEDERLGSMNENMAAALGVREAPREPDSIAAFKKAGKKDGPASLSDRMRQLRNS